MTPDIERLRILAIDGDPEATAEYARQMVRRGDGLASCVPPLPPPPVTRPTLPWCAIHREKCASIYRAFKGRRMRCRTTEFRLRENCRGRRGDCVNVLAPITLRWSIRCRPKRTKGPTCLMWRADCSPDLGRLFSYRLPSRTEEANM